MKIGISAACCCWLLSSAVSALVSPTNSDNGVISRREGLRNLATATVGAILPTIIAPQSSSAIDLPERQALVDAIESRAPKEQILKRLSALLQTKQSTTPSTAPTTERIDGRWLLVWSDGDENFSPLLQLPKPLKPTSYQCAGSEAAPIVGEGRIVQMLTGGVLGNNKAWLSSGVVPTGTSDILEIRPPFRFELETSPNEPRKVIVEANSDADFRTVNARTAEAQRAPPNLYQQLYLENEGPGSLRVSKVIEGDPVIVGALLIHRKL